MSHLRPALPADRHMQGQINVSTPPVAGRMKYLCNVGYRVFHRLNETADHRKAEGQPSELRPGDLALLQLAGPDRDRGPSKLPARYSLPIVSRPHIRVSRSMVCTTCRQVLSNGSAMVCFADSLHLRLPPTSPNPCFTQFWLPAANETGANEAKGLGDSNAKCESKAGDFKDPRLQADTARQGERFEHAKRRRRRPSINLSRQCEGTPKVPCRHGDAQRLTAF